VLLSLGRKFAKRSVNCTRLGAWMEAIIDRAQARFQHVCVDLRRRQISMAEHHLNGAQIGAMFEQMRREGVAQHVGAEPPREPRLPAVAFQDFPEPDAAQAVPPLRIYEQPWAGLF